MRYTIGALGDDSTDTSGGDSSPAWLSNLITGATAFFTGRQQIDTVAKLNEINMQRRAQGLPPLDYNIATPGVNIGLSSGTQNLLMYGAVGLGAVWLATTLMKRRR